MPGRLRIYVPIDMFPSEQDLAPLCPDARVVVDRALPSATVMWPSRRLTLTRLPKDEAAKHLQEAVDHVRAAGGSEALVLRLVQTLTVLNVEVEPDAGEGGEVVDLIRGIVRAADGLCFLGGEIWDAEGRGLLLAKEGGLRPPEPSRVAARAWVLLAIATRGLLEQDGAGSEKPEAERRRDALVDRVCSMPGVENEIEREEFVFLEAPIGEAERQAVIDAVWKAEGAHVLLWALGARALPPQDEQEHPYLVARDVGLLGGEPPPRLLVPHLRPEEEIDALRRTLTGITWRLRRHPKPHPGSMDFEAFASKAWFGRFSLDTVPLVENDLSIGGQPVFRADPARVQRALSLALERHQAANWLAGVHPVYSRVPTPTELAWLSGES